MGSTSFRNFHNDDAQDFLLDFADDPSEVLLLEALVTAAEEEGSLEVDLTAQALVAAEVVAAWLGEPAPDFPADLLPLAEELDVRDEDELRALARRAVQTVLQKSELRELHQQAGTLAEWQTAQTELLQRLE